MKLTGLIVALALLPGCSTHPITGREQIIALPAVQVAYADASYALSTGAQRIAGSPSCEQDCGSAEDLARFVGRVETIGKQLEADEIAIAFLERTGVSASSVALGLESGVKRARLPDDDWGARYVDSTRRVALIAASPPRYAVIGD